MIKRKITIEIELSEEDTEAYNYVCSELVIEDFVLRHLPSDSLSINIISDNHIVYRGY